MVLDYRKAYRLIKKYPNIIIGRHIGPDPDGLASQIALKQIILDAFPKKNVYAVGLPASKFRFLGTLDKLEEAYYENSLVIILDTPDIKRIDGISLVKANAVLKIDHHPKTDTFGDVELVDETSTSACQLVMELVEQTPLKLSKETFEKLYIGLVADTNRFLYKYTSARTFALVSKYITKFQVDVSRLYDGLYLRPFAEMKFQGYLKQNLTLTEQGVAYIFIDAKTIQEFEVDAASAGNMINDLNYIEEAFVIATFSEDIKNKNIRVSIRSRGPIINTVAEHYHGGGHIYASGARLESKEQVTAFVQELNAVCSKYKKV